MFHPHFLTQISIAYSSNLLQLSPLFLDHKMEPENQETAGFWTPPTTYKASIISQLQPWYSVEETSNWYKDKVQT